MALGEQWFTLQPKHKEGRPVSSLVMLLVDMVGQFFTMALAATGVLEEGAVLLNIIPAMVVVVMVVMVKEHSLQEKAKAPQPLNSVSMETYCMPVVAVEVATV